MSLLLLDADALGTIVAATITDDWVGASTLAEVFPFLTASSVTDDFMAAVTVNGGAVFIPANASDVGRIAVVTHAN